MSSLQHVSTTPPAPQQSSLSFTQGFLLGQLTIVLLLSAFIKFFIFGEPPSSETTFSARARNRSTTTPHHCSISLTSSSNPRNLNPKRSASHILRPPPPLTTATILEKTYYNVHSHQPESLDWFNVLIAQTIAQFRQDALCDDAILISLTTLLNGDKTPEWLGEIRVTEIGLGEEFPILSNCRVGPAENFYDGGGGGDGQGREGGRLQAKMDVDLSDAITLGVETKVLLNYPKPFTAVLPVALAVSVVRFSGTLSVSFLPSQTTTTTSNTTPADGSPSTTPTTLAFSFLPDYRLDLSVRSLVGSRSRLQDLPKIAQLVESRLHKWIDERCVEPRVQEVVLPSLWPEKRNTRGMAGGGDEEGGLEGVGGGAGGGGGKGDRDVREEARREIEEERRRDGVRREREREEGVGAFEDGLRIRKRAFESMPGSLPGMMANDNFG